MHFLSSGCSHLIVFIDVVTAIDCNKWFAFNSVTSISVSLSEASESSLVFLCWTTPYLFCAHTFAAPNMLRLRHSSMYPETSLEVSLILLDLKYMFLGRHFPITLEIHFSINQVNWSRRRVLGFSFNWQPFDITIVETIFTFPGNATQPFVSQWCRYFLFLPISFLNRHAETCNSFFAFREH